MARLLLLTIVLIAYGSLYPWHFHAYQHAYGPLWVLSHPAPVYWNRSAAIDIAVNVLVYLPLGFFAFAALAAMWRTWVAAIVALLIGITLSFSVEMAQFFVVSRVSSALDVAANGLGTAAGIAAASVWWRHHHTSETPVRSDSMFLIACWVLYQVFPFIPHRGRPSLIDGPAVDALLYFATMIALWPVIDALGGSIRKKRLTLAVLVMIVPLKVVLFARDITIAELVSTVAAFATALLLPLSARVAAGIVGVAIAVHGLAPFVFQGPAQAFSWVPFQASIISNWEPGVGVLLGKVFTYGSLLWLIREAGVRLPTATMSTVALLATVEVAQMYLPGRTSEITDPVIALILAWVFWSLAPNRSLTVAAQKRLASLGRLTEPRQ